MKKTSRSTNKRQKLKNHRSGLSLLRKTISKAKSETGVEFNTFLPFQEERDALGRLLPRIEMVERDLVTLPNIPNRTGDKSSFKSTYLIDTSDDIKKWKMNRNKVKKPRYEEYCKCQRLTKI